MGGYPRERPRGTVVAVMPAQLAESDWSLLLSAIERGACTPFLGPGVNHGRLPLPGDIAMRWAEESGYPLEDRWNFPRVAQFVAQQRGPRSLLDDLATTLSTADAAPPAPDDPLSLLAELPFTTYVTTAYDDLLARALRASPSGRGERTRRPRVDHCRWSEALSSSSLATIFEQDPHYQPSVAEPFVFHLDGQLAVEESLVLTEDDHFDLLVATARHPNRVPPPVQRALRGGPLLFIGQPLTDWNFRALRRSLCGADFSGLQHGTVSVHAPLPEGNDEVVAMLERGEARAGVRVHWGSAQAFLQELRERWSRAARR